MESFQLQNNCRFQNWPIGWLLESISEKVFCQNKNVCSLRLHGGADPPSSCQGEKPHPSKKKFLTQYLQSLWVRPPSNFKYVPSPQVPKSRLKPIFWLFDIAYFQITIQKLFSQSADRIWVFIKLRFGCVLTCKITILSLNSFCYNI